MLGVQPAAKSTACLAGTSLSLRAGLEETPVSSHGSGASISSDRHAISIHARWLRSPAAAGVSSRIGSSMVRSSDNRRPRASDPRMDNAQANAGGLAPGDIDYHLAKMTLLGHMRKRLKSLVECKFSIYHRGAEAIQAPQPAASDFTNRKTRRIAWGSISGNSTTDRRASIVLRAATVPDIKLMAAGLKQLLNDRIPRQKRSSTGRA